VYYAANDGIVDTIDWPELATSPQISTINGIFRYVLSGCIIPTNAYTKDVGEDKIIWRVP